jgi:putative RNA 2'-phosphotransferase
MDQATRLVRVSKYLSKHLRHQPQRLGLCLDVGGWVAVEALLAACATDGMAISRAELEDVVARNDKRRFAFDETRTLIRANQGHSVPVDLRLAPVTPPAVLYHGTGERAVDAIQRAGLLKMRRHHVHLSPDRATARKVGARHGRPIVLAVDAAAMHQAGRVLYHTANGVWLVECVPPEFLRQLDPGHKVADVPVAGA